MNKIYAGKSHLSTQHAPHCHENWEIVSNIEGTGMLEFENETIPFDDRTVVCLPPHTAHAKRADNVYRDIWISCPSLPALDHTKPTILSDDCNRNISSLIRVLYSVQYSKAPNAYETMNSLLDSIQQLILSRIDRKKMDARVEMIVNQIINHFQEPAFSLEDCLSQNGYCTDHMRRLFCDQVGKTPHEYLVSLRIKTAKRLLASRSISNYSVSEIAAMVGFQDASYFSRIFKKHTGISPGEYWGE